MKPWQYKPGSDPNYISHTGQGFNPGSIEDGYYVTLPSEPNSGGSLKDPLGGTPMDPANHSPSGYLQNYKGEQVALWITQAQISFTVGGTFVQSPRLREFFPRNLIDPVWSIQGITPNSFQYQRLAEFIRTTHFDVLDPTGLSDIGSHLPTLHINAGGLGDLSQLQQSDMKHFVPDQKKFLADHPNTVQGKGPHSAQHMKGFIASFSRGAQRFINVPTYEFQFTVAISYGDLFQISNWGQIYKYMTEPTAIKYSDLGTGQANRAAPPASVLPGA